MKPILFIHAFVLCLLVGCAAQGPLVTTWQADKIAQNNATYTRLNDSKGETIATLETAKARRLNAIKDRIATASGQQAQLYVMTGTEPNAMSTYLNGSPVVGVNLAMIDMLQGDDDAYAAILGHEFAHLILGHGEIRKQREQTRSTASTILGNLLGFAGVPMGGTIAGLATTAVSTVYSRDEERDADRYGVGYMRSAGFDPKGAVRAWERMSKASGPSIPFLATHPPSSERLETMKKLAE